MKLEIVETDVLCIGGGPAGLMAAIRASELGAKVIVADKANTVRSGAAANGNDHFLCYIPEVHGPDVAPCVADYQRRHKGELFSDEMVRFWYENSFNIVKLWDSWGIPMKYEGRYEFAGHAFPGELMTHMKYSGQGQKTILTNEARKRGVEIINRVMVFELLRDNDIAGAIGVSTREDKILVFRAKAVVLATGVISRLYPASTPACLFNTPFSPTTTGDGRAMAYRAGAELVGMETYRRWAGPKYLARCGKGTWIGVLRDAHDKPVAPFVSKPERKYGDIAADIYTNMFEDYAQSGEGPIYMDCRGISEEDYEYMVYWLRQEGNAATLDHLQDEGIDVRKNPIEFATYGIFPSGGILFNTKAETSVKGLYAAGDEFNMNISFAAVFGWAAGGNATQYAQEVSLPSMDIANPKIQESKRLLEEIRTRTTGPSWKEANIALQQIMSDYAGRIRSETMLNAGLTYLERLREKACSSIMAETQHNLARCLEVFNLLDLGEAVFTTALARNETRGRHTRTDCPWTNPLLDNKLLVVRKVDGKPVAQWKEKVA